MVSLSSTEQPTQPVAAGRGWLLAQAIHSSDGRAPLASKLYIDSVSVADKPTKEFVVTEIPNQDDVIEEVNLEEEKVYKKIGKKG